jgi:hypothetical protein
MVVGVPSGVTVRMAAVMMIVVVMITMLVSVVVIVSHEYAGK